jgi:hypothetical protein
MTLDNIFGVAVSVALMFLIVLRLSGVVRDVGRILIHAGPYVIVGGWLVDIIT